MKNVLIVDDDDDFREALGAALTLKGFNIRHATNGHEALRDLRGSDEVPCAMLIDLMMPEMDGWQLIKLLRGDPALAAIPSAVVSASQDVASMSDKMTTFAKPCDLRDLLRFLEHACP